MSVQPRNVKPDKPAPRSYARPIFTPSADIGSAYAWISPYDGQLQVSTDALDSLPRVVTDVDGRRTLLIVGRPIWVAKYLMMGWPDADALPDALWDFLEMQFGLDHAEGKRHLWLASAPIMYGGVAVA